MKRKYIRTSYKEMYDAEKGNCESIEEKIERITENNEPISDGVQMIFTPRKNGVMAQYNVRADKWEISQAAMENVNQAKKATINKKLKGNEPKTEEPKTEEPKTEEPKTES